MRADESSGLSVVGLVCEYAGTCSAGTSQKLIDKNSSIVPTW